MPTCPLARLGSPGRIGFLFGAMPYVTRMLRCLPTALAAAAMGFALAGPAVAQAPGPGGGAPPRGRSLQQDPADWWGDVHRWTGSEETRPRSSRPPPEPRPAASPEEGRTVITTAGSRANIRREPSLSAEVVRQVPPATRLRVFAEGPGGWFQVGGEAPIGWIHQSVLQR